MNKSRLPRHRHAKLLEILEEAVSPIRELWTGGVVSHHGRHHTVEDARMYTLPDTPPRIHASGFGAKAG
jgi:alkanesulfonate monooxygenase SsuD/methylene tetrahydromethanopterin reductase-like flavin-dependent oxidoreductase (luciferase family)